MGGPQRKDLAGQRFGRLTVIELHSPGPNRNGTWRCRCTCGGEKLARTDKLRQGRVLSCGAFTCRRQTRAPDDAVLMCRRCGAPVTGRERRKSGTTTCRACLLLQRRAYSRVRYAIETGRLIPPEACERCGATPRSGRRLDAHHADYAKPLEVEWLCRPCHHGGHFKSLPPPSIFPKSKSFPF